MTIDPPYPIHYSFGIDWGLVRYVWAHHGVFNGSFAPPTETRRTIELMGSNPAVRDYGSTLVGEPIQVLGLVKEWGAER